MICPFVSGLFDLVYYLQVHPCIFCQKFLPFVEMNNVQLYAVFMYFLKVMKNAKD